MTSNEAFLNAIYRNDAKKKRATEKAPELLELARAVVALSDANIYDTELNELANRARDLIAQIETD